MNDDTNLENIPRIPIDQSYKENDSCFGGCRMLFRVVNRGPFALDFNAHGRKAAPLLNCHRIKLSLAWFHFQKCMVVQDPKRADYMSSSFQLYAIGSIMLRALPQR